MFVNDATLGLPESSVDYVLSLLERCTVTFDRYRDSEWMGDDLKHLAAEVDRQVKIERQVVRGAVLAELRRATLPAWAEEMCSTREAAHPPLIALERLGAVLEQALVAGIRVQYVSD